MSDSSTIFNGTSRYASDFQQIIDRAVNIASLPLMQLQAQKNTLNDRSSALTSLENSFSAISAALSDMDSASGAGSISASVSDESVLRAMLGSGALEGEYGIEVLSAGAYTSSLSSDGLPVVADPSTQNLSSASSFSLTVDGSNFTISPASNSLWSLATAINAAGAGVKATILNIGSPSQPDYRLAVRSEKLADVSIQINDGTTDLLGTLTAGSPLTYRVNGQPASPISSDTRTVTIAPGVLAELRSTGTSVITVSRSAESAKNAISAFVKAYNAAVDEMDKHRGTANGALSGDALLPSLSASLREITSYSGAAGGARTLADLGVTLDQHGKLSFDESVFGTLTATDPSAVFDFLGSTTSGGFLKVAHDVLNRTSDSSDSSIQLAVTSVTQQLSEQDKLIAQNQDRVEALRENLVAQMAAADALVASLEQELALITGLFEAQKSSQSSTSS